MISGINREVVAREEWLSFQAYGYSRKEDRLMLLSEMPPAGQPGRRAGLVLCGPGPGVTASRKETGKKRMGNGRKRFPLKEDDNVYNDLNEKHGPERMAENKKDRIGRF